MCSVYASEGVFSEALVGVQVLVYWRGKGGRVVGGNRSGGIKELKWKGLVGRRREVKG